MQAFAWEHSFWYRRPDGKLAKLNDDQIFETEAAARAAVREWLDNELQSLRWLKKQLHRKQQKLLREIDLATERGIIQGG